VQRPLDFATKARKVPGFIPHRVFFGIPKLINLLQGSEPLAVALAGGPKARSLVPLGLEGAPEFGHSGPGLPAISDGSGHGSGAVKGLHQPLDADAAVTLGALNPWKPHLSYDLEGTNGSEGGNQ